VRLGNDTKTPKSRRTLALPSIAVRAFQRQWAWQHDRRRTLGEAWPLSGLVFTTGAGTALRADNVRRDFRIALRGVPGIDPEEWTPRELRHSFVSLLSASDVPIEEVSRLVGHSDIATTETVYRHELRPVMQTGAQAMDVVFG
jgi:integrase